jgi:hypothetical protein
VSAAAIGSAAAAARRFAVRVRPRRSAPAAAVVLALAAVVAYIAAGRSFMAGSRLGVAFGIAAAVALLVVMAYSVRRALPAVRALGPTQAYLEVHVAGGLLFLVLMLLHTDLRVPSGFFTILLWLVALWVVVSGLIGLALQRSVPRILDATTSFEANLQRIPELVVELRSRAQLAAAQAGPGVQAYYAREIAPDMARPRAAIASVLGRSRVESYRSHEFQILRRTITPEMAPKLEQLRQLHHAKLELDLHYTLQRALRIWLAAHLPVAIVLLGLVALHVFLVLYF